MCNKRIVSGKELLAIASVVYPVGVTKNQKQPLAIILNRCVLQLLRLLLTILSVFIRLKIPSKC